jgi:hypothetical protein
VTPRFKPGLRYPTGRGFLLNDFAVYPLFLSVVPTPKIHGDFELHPILFTAALDDVQDDTVPPTVNPMLIARAAFVVERGGRAGFQLPRLFFIDRTRV